MGVDNITPDGSSDDADNSSDDPSVSYAYVYERGREETEEWSQESRDQMAAAYEAFSDGGAVRSQLNGSGRFENVHDGLGRFIASLGTSFDHPGYIAPVLASISNELLPALSASLEEDDAEDLLEWMEPDADDLQAYLAEHDEVAEELAEEMDA